MNRQKQHIYTYFMAHKFKKELTIVLLNCLCKIYEKYI
jgi:hypothetical protein